LRGCHEKKWRKKKKNKKQQQHQFTFGADMLPIFIWELEVACPNLTKEVFLVIIGKGKGAGQPEGALVRNQKRKKEKNEKRKKKKEAPYMA
jgi:hypothetical protein